MVRSALTLSRRGLAWRLHSLRCLAPCSPGTPRYDVIRQKHRIVIRYAVITPVTVITGTVTRNLRKSCLDRLTCRCYTRTQELALVPAPLGRLGVLGYRQCRPGSEPGHFRLGALGRAWARV